MPVTQKDRLLAIDTALGADVLVVRSISLRESISRPFTVEVDLRAEPGDQGDINFDDVLGTNVTIRVELGDKGTRYINGFVSRFSQGDNEGGMARFRAEVVPWLWFLTRTADCRIFQNKSIPEIIEDVFKAQGFTDFKLNLSGSYKPWEFCVQYRETDFNFVNRLMEEEGMYYYFEHENGKHTLVLADTPNGHTTLAGFEEVTFHELEKGGSGQGAITEWRMSREVQPGSYSLNDYFFEKPKTSLLASANVSRPHGGASYEIFDYPGEYLSVSEGERLAQVRLDEFQSRYEVLQGNSAAGGLSAGRKFKMKGHPRSEQNRDYVITATTLHVDAGEYASSDEKTEFLSCKITAIPFTQKFRPPRITPKPIVQGPQTAVVVGPKGEEIHTDKYGRVKVQFHWDRYGKGDENSSCWIRVSQLWAGKGWGAVHTPRIGQEVIIEFLEGDPDQPIVTGKVYNDAVMPPYPLPDKKTLSGIKTNSSKGGGGFNELRFEDAKGDEQVFIHAEKNMDVRVKSDCFEWIGNKRHLVVKKDQIEHVENNRHETVDKDHVEKIGKDRHLKVLGKEAKEVDKTLSLTVKEDVTEVFKGSHSEEVSKDLYFKAANIVLEASSNITLKVGGSTIAIEGGGIGIKTSGQLKIESTGPASIKSDAPLTVESSAKTDVKSPMTSVNGDGMVIIKGGLVKIN